MDVAKVANNSNDLVKGSSTRKKLQNSKGYTESPEFSPALGLIGRAKRAPHWGVQLRFCVIGQAKRAPTLGCSIEISRDIYVGMSYVCRMSN